MFYYPFKCLNNVKVFFCPMLLEIWNITFFFYIHGSVHRHSLLIRSNKMQLYAGIYYRKITLHVSGVIAPIIRST